MPYDERKDLYFESTRSSILEDYEFSSATKVDYTHYRLALPREGERFLRSGNFLLHIYEEDSLVLTRRFMVVDPQVSVT
ncbi:MAG: type IX secretion system plug protein domain-containing protein, partial [Planctomycetaceae bacterium]